MTEIRTYTLNVAIEVDSVSLRDAEEHVSKILEKAFEKDQKSAWNTKLRDFDFYLRDEE